MDHKPSGDTSANLLTKLGDLELLTEIAKPQADAFHVTSSMNDDSSVSIFLRKNGVGGSNNNYTLILSVSVITTEECFIFIRK